MKIESLRLTVESDELEAALKCIAMPQNVRIRGAHFEPEELVIDLSLLLPLPLYPSVHVSVVQAAGPTVCLQVSTPIMAGMVDLFMSRRRSLPGQGNHEPRHPCARWRHH